MSLLRVCLIGDGHLSRPSYVPRTRDYTPGAPLPFPPYVTHDVLDVITASYVTDFTIVGHIAIYRTHSSQTKG